MRFVQFTIRELLIITSLTGLCIAFPEFSFFVPVGIGMMLIPLAVCGVVFLLSAWFESTPKSLMKASGRNFVSILFVLAGLLAYGLYGLYAVDWDMG